MAAFEIGTIIGVVNLIATIFTIVGILTLFKAISMLFGADKAVESGSESLFSWLKSKGKSDEEKVEIDTEKKKNKNKLKLNTLNEYIDEEKEIDYLKSINQAIEDWMIYVRHIYSKGKFENKKEVDEVYKKLIKIKDNIEKSKNLFRKIKRRTFRQQTRIGRIIANLRGKGVDTSQAEAIENNILKLHEETYNELNNIFNEMDIKTRSYKIYKDNADRLFDRFKSVDLVDNNIDSFHSKPKILEIVNNVKNIKDPKLKEIIEKQESTVNLLKGLLANMNELIEENPDKL